MSFDMLVHDKRALGIPPSIANNTFDVDASVSIQHCIGWVAHCAKTNGGIDNLFLLCHGKGSHLSGRQDSSNAHVTGGFGLALCSEMLTLRNVSLVASWKDLIERITVIACAAAETAPGNAGTEGDGKRFLGELALWSGAQVIGSNTNQSYTITATGVMHLKDWAGTVYSFDPDTGHATPIHPEPMPN